MLVRLYCRHCKMGSDVNRWSSVEKVICHNCNTVGCWITINEPTKAWALTENDAKMLKDHAIKPE